MLSVCMITRNEEKNIRRCLESLRPYPLELVVVDTGSGDRTKEIAQNYTDLVFDFPWQEDFSAARNYSLSKASNPYVMVVDCDEYLETLDMPGLQRLIKEYPDQVGRIRQRNLLSGDHGKSFHQEWISRIFPRKLYCYTGTIHEQVTARSGIKYKTYEAPVLLEHSGYDLTEEERREKAQRNIHLLERELERLEGREVGKGQESAEEEKAYVLFQLGKSYYLIRQYDKACLYFSQALSFDLDPDLEFVIDMVETYGYALINSGRAQNALFFQNIYQEFGDSADFKFLMGLIYMKNSMFDAAIHEFQEALGYSASRAEGANSYLASYNAGVICDCLGRTREAARYYKMCGDYPPAQKQLKVLELGHRI